MEAKSRTMSQRNVLGRGLSALISTPPVPAIAIAGTSNEPPQSDEDKNFTSAGIRYLDINALEAGATQPRTLFDENEVDELAQSIKMLGVLQPILVRPKRGAAGRYEIIAGERRFRAAQRAKLDSVPAIVKELDDKSALEVALVENIQRENLNPVELARAFERLAQTFSLSHEEIADRVGKERASISNILRILKLPAEALSMIEDKSLSLGHAKALLSIKDPQAQIRLARRVTSENLTVRALEDMVSHVAILDSGKRRKAVSALNPAQAVTAAISETANNDSEYRDVLEKLRTALGTKVEIQFRTAQKSKEREQGRVIVEFFSLQELERIVELIVAGSSSSNMT